MTSEGLHGRIAELERQLVELRRELTPEVEPFPREPAAYLELSAGQGRYLVEVASLREVLPVVWPTPLPDAPRWVRGTIRYGERVVPLIDIERRLHDLDRALALDDLMTVVESPKWLALRVDGVGGVLWLAPQDLSPLPPGIPQAPFLVAMHASSGGATAYVLSLRRLGRDVLIGEDEQ
ncbi:MAG: chemotaxis protein CheW [Sandaracinaceae bacterium]|nr:chemotaxis protein CheW [Sandaracinaceae bacterium]